MKEVQSQQTRSQDNEQQKIGSHLCVNAYSEIGFADIFPVRFSRTSFTENGNHSEHGEQARSTRVQSDNQFNED
uniref:Uncharacterized protein n=1 Tax=Arundo donax TaxID=35708 RepID=A0A0A9GYJ7_ARUDO